MIQIDMPIPEKCGDCPCFHAENPMYCQAIKADGKKKIVAPYGLPRPEWCPLKEQEKKKIKLHKKHLIKWKDDDYTTAKLYEAVCETLMDEGELVIVRRNDHEKVDFTFYVTHEDI